MTGLYSPLLHLKVAEGPPAQGCWAASRPEIKGMDSPGALGATQPHPRLHCSPVQTQVELAR